MESAPEIDGIPGPLRWQNPPAHWKIDNRQTLTITADKHTDWYVPAFDGQKSNNTPRLLFKPAEDFVLSAKVDVSFQNMWDAGVLVLYVNDALWAKLGLEMTLEKHPAIVSVVTREISDDNNSIAIRGSSVYLKVIKAGQAICFYASEDGQKWMLVRVFTLGKNLDLRIGFSSQSPQGDSCTTVFTHIQYLGKKVDLFAGQ